MAPTLRAPRGTRDRLPEDAAAWARAEETAADLSSRYGFERIETPLFEATELFVRGLGEETDAVAKEMFRVGGAAGTDDEEPAWALRPEPTAGIVRAYLEHGLHVRPGPLRLWLTGSMFRYDRPQAGRYRQFTQWDVEVIGDPGPAVDAELIELATRYCDTVGLEGVTVRLNSIGDAECRPAYRAALVDFFTTHRGRLGPDGQRRLDTNPLRVLDDRDLDPGLAADAPRSADHLCDACAAHFAAVRALLDRLGVAYLLDHRLVRGLDYYTRTTFELFATGREGQQDALAGGGRYDGLVETLGGPPTPGIGFGLGLDRIVLAMAERGVPGRPAPALIAVVGTRPDDVAERLIVAGALREAGIRVRPDGSGRKLGRQLESAAKVGARWAVIVGEELTRGAVVLRDLADGTQREVRLDEVAPTTRSDEGTETAD
ncbi:MAG TPA: histidine--tRNA ligase [Candidatus Limnocylindria bacterium]